MEYNPRFVGHRPILSSEDKQMLRALSDAYPLERFRADARNYDEMMVDFVYTSAKIEGNTYDRLDTDNLLRMGLTSGGKRYTDAVMLVNLRDAFGMAMATEPSTDLNLEYLCGLHKTLMRDLLPAGQQGIGRTDGVTIGASTYTPLSDPNRLRTEVRFILQEANKYDDPFEQSIYLHCNVAYLQFFKDGNKRTARMMQTSALVRGGALPLFFNDTLIDKYKRATVRYYETGDYGPYVSFFKENYHLAVKHLLGKEPILDLQHGEERTIQKQNSAKEPSAPEPPVKEGRKTELSAPITRANPSQRTDWDFEP